MLVTKLKLATMFVFGVVAIGCAVGTLARGVEPAPAPVVKPVAPLPEAPPQALVADPLVPLREAAKAKAPDGKKMKFGMERIDRLIEDLIERKKTDREILDVLFLATLARLPEDAEAKKLLDQVAKPKAEDRKGAFKEVAWGLTNSAEFLRHIGELSPVKPLQLEIPRLNRLKPKKSEPNAPGDGPFFDQ
jgi:hypothetical protein